MEWKLCVPCLLGLEAPIADELRRLDIKNIAALSFETHDGRRYFVVHAANSKGIPYERRALLPPRNVTKPGIVTEQDIIGFLYEMNLGHLIKETCEEEGAYAMLRVAGGK